MKDLYKWKNLDEIAGGRYLQKVRRYWEKYLIEDLGTQIEAGRTLETSKVQREGS